VIGAAHPPQSDVVTTWIWPHGQAPTYHSFQSAAELNGYVEQLQRLRDEAWPPPLVVATRPANVIPLPRRGGA